MDVAFMPTVSCEKCHLEIADIYVKCAECAGEICFCLNCFSSGCEVGKHQNNHAYKIVDNATFSLLNESWTAKEEQALLFGVEHFGLGNWEAVAEFIKSKTGREAEEHYMLYYVESSDMGRVSIPANISNRMTDHTPPLHESLVSAKIPETSIPKAERLSLAYMPLRDDFELEHDNDAETIVSGLSTSADESELDQKLKVAQAQMYVTRLKERQNRKTLSQEYQLVPLFFGKLFLSVKEDNDFFTSIKSCVRFMKQNQMKKFLFDWQREKRLKSQMTRLSRYRQHGLKRMAETEIFDILYKKRERHLNETKQVLTPNNHKPEDARVRIRDINLDMKYINQGTNLLCASEYKLCQSIKMHPLRYVTCKMLIFRDCVLRTHSVPGVKSRLHVFADKNQRKRIINLIQINGWHCENISNAITAS